jgi:hypothetical protein
MTVNVRRAGRGRLANLGTVVWSVAEGSRGRRWRELRRDGRGVLVSSLLLETSPDGTFTHMELSTVAGLLTLHPEPDRTLHGNVITDDGVRHVVGFPWPPGSVVLVEGSPIAAAAALRSFAIDAADRPREATAARVDLALDVTTERVSVGRSANSSAIGEWSSLELDADDLPVLSHTETWPLEVD